MTEGIAGLFASAIEQAVSMIIAIFDTVSVLVEKGIVLCIAGHGKWQLARRADRAE